MQEHPQMPPVTAVWGLTLDTDSLDSLKLISSEVRS